MGRPLSRVAHLVRRFFQVAFARPLSADEAAEVIAALASSSEPLLALFNDQDAADQRHAHTVMRRVAAQTDDRQVIAAALLHDVGKAGLGMGAISRSLATAGDALRLPMTARMTAYRHHGPVGAERLEAVGAKPLVVDFARRHPDPEPGPHDPGTWSILLEADQT